MILIDPSLEELIKIAEQTVYAGDFHQGIKLLEGCLAEEPGYPKLHYTLGWIYHYYLEDKSKAERHYQLAIYFNKEYKEAYEYLAELYFDNKKLKGLKILMEKAKEVEEIEKDFIYSMLGKIEEIEGNYTSALKFYRKALISCMDNETLKQMKLNIKRARFKRFKKSWVKWQLTN